MRPLPPTPIGSAHPRGPAHLEELSCPQVPTAEHHAVVEAPNPRCFPALPGQRHVLPAVGVEAMAGGGSWKGGGRKKRWGSQGVGFCAPQWSLRGGGGGGGGQHPRRTVMTSPPHPIPLHCRTRGGGVPPHGDDVTAPYPPNAAPPPCGLPPTRPVGAAAPERAEPPNASAAAPSLPAEPPPPPPARPLLPDPSGAPPRLRAGGGGRKKRLTHAPLPDRGCGRGEMTSTPLRAVMAMRRGAVTAHAQMSR